MGPRGRCPSATLPTRQTQNPRTLRRGRCLTYVRQPDPTAPADLAPNSAPASVDGQQPIDPELVALTAPPQGQRIAALTVMAAAVVAMMALLISLRGDMAYTLAAATPTELGSIHNVAVSQLVPNSYVRLSGVPAVARAVRFRRGLGSAYVILPLAGQRSVFVQLPDGTADDFVRSSYSGRLVRLGDLGRRYAQLATVMQRDAELPVTEESFVLLVGEQPADYAWTWLAGAICLLFVGLDVFLIVRWFRPLKWAQIGPTAPR